MKDNACSLCRKVVEFIESKKLNGNQKRVAYFAAYRKIADKITATHCGVDQDAICCPKCGAVMFKEGK